MAAYIDETEQKERAQALKILEEQISVEVKLIGLYKQLINETENKPIQHMFRIIQTDSMKHIDMLKSAKEIIQGQDILIKDRKVLKANLQKHLEFEKTSIEKGNQLLRYQWIKDKKKGLHTLLQNWRDEEKRHHNFLKTLAKNPTYLSVLVIGMQFLELRKPFLRNGIFDPKDSLINRELYDVNRNF